MSQTQYLHHYTTIDTLALILKNKTLRFNRLDRVNDLGESQKYGDYHLAQCIFVSCWTDSDEESIPLWTIYSRGMTGIRISLPIDPFDYQPIQPHPIWGGGISGQLLAPIPIEMIIGDGFIISPTWWGEKKQGFIKKVEYLKSEDLSKIRESAVKLNPENFEVAGTATLAGYKKLDWAFEQEVRYILMATPTPPMSSKGPADGTWVSNIGSHLMKSMRDGSGPGFDHIDLNLAPNVLDFGQVQGLPKKVELHDNWELWTTNFSRSELKFTRTLTGISEPTR